MIHVEIIPKRARDISFLLFGESIWRNKSILWMNSFSTICGWSNWCGHLIDDNTRCPGLDSNDVIRDVLLILFLRTIWGILTDVADSNFRNSKRSSRFDFFLGGTRSFSPWSSYRSLWVIRWGFSWAGSGEFGGKLCLARWLGWIGDIGLQGLPSVHFVTHRHVSR